MRNDAVCHKRVCFQKLHYRCEILCIRGKGKICTVFLLDDSCNCQPVMVSKPERTHVMTRSLFKALNCRSIWNWNVRLKWTCFELECGNGTYKLLCSSILCWHSCVHCIYLYLYTKFGEPRVFHIKSFSFSSVEYRNETATMVSFPQTQSVILRSANVWISFYFSCVCVLYSCNPKQGLIKWEAKTQLPSRQSWVISHLFQPFSPLPTPLYLDLYGLLKDDPSWLQSVGEKKWDLKKKKKKWRRNWSDRVS